MGKAWLIGGCLAMGERNISVSDTQVKVSKRNLNSIIRVFKNKFRRNLSMLPALIFI
jgi:hypothetical protein